VAKLYGVFSAVLDLAGVSALRISGPILDGDYVTDGQLADPLGREIDLVGLIGGDGGSGTAEMLLAGSGARINFNYSGCSLVRLKSVRKLEQWKEE
jgi:hypothetical protein